MKIFELLREPGEVAKILRKRLTFGVRLMIKDAKCRGAGIEVHFVPADPERTCCRDVPDGEFTRSDVQSALHQRPGQQHTL